MGTMLEHNHTHLLLSGPKRQASGYAAVSAFKNGDDTQHGVSGQPWPYTGSPACFRQAPCQGPQGSAVTLRDGQPRRGQIVTLLKRQRDLPCRLAATGEARSRRSLSQSSAPNQPGSSSSALKSPTSPSPTGEPECPSRVT